MVRSGESGSNTVPQSSGSQYDEFQEESVLRASKIPHWQVVWRWEASAPDNAETGQGPGVVTSVFRLQQLGEMIHT